MVFAGPLKCKLRLKHDARYKRVYDLVAGHRKGCACALAACVGLPASEGGMGVAGNAAALRWLTGQSARVAYALASLVNVKLPVFMRTAFTRVLQRAQIFHPCSAELQKYRRGYLRVQNHVYAILLLHKRYNI